MLIKAKGINTYQKFAVLVSYPAMTLGVLLVFARWLIDTFWIRLVIGLCVFGIGILIRQSINWINKSH